MNDEWDYESGHLARKRGASAPMDKPLPEFFLLYRDGRFYAGHSTQALLQEIVRSNPDFAQPEDGRPPSAQIVRYVLADAIREARHE